jgi:hypothetical protein
MKTSDFTKLQKRLLPRIGGGLAVKGRYSFLTPVGKTLRGFFFDDSSHSAKHFYVTAFFMPLCVPSQHVTLTFGKRIGVSQRWNIEQGELEQKLSAAMSEVMPWLIGLGTPQAVMHALELIESHTNLNWLEAYTYTLLEVGRITSAAERLNELLRVLDVAIPWQEHMLARATLIQRMLSLSLEDTQRQLALWRKDSISSLGLPPLTGPAD